MSVANFDTVVTQRSNYSTIQPDEPLPVVTWCSLLSGFEAIFFQNRCFEWKNVVKDKQSANNATENQMSNMDGAGDSMAPLVYHLSIRYDYNATTVIKGFSCMTTDLGLLSLFHVAGGQM